MAKANKVQTTSEKIRLDNVRLSFPRLWVPKAFQAGQTERYEASFLLDPSDAKHAAIIKKIKSEAEKLKLLSWGPKEKRPKGVKHCYGLADKDPVKSDYDGYKGMFYIASNEKNKPKVVDRNPKIVLDEKAGRPYAGCRVNGLITLWLQDNQYGRRINANLLAVQFAADDEAFGVAPVDVEEEFDALEEGEVIDEGWDDEDDED